MHHAHRVGIAVIAAGACSFVANGRASAEEVDTAAVVFASESQPQIKLDLKIGDLTQILTPEQLEQALGMNSHRLSGVETPADEQIEQIEVHAVREQYEAVKTDVPFGLASLAWAIQNPTEAWRIFLPVEIEGEELES